MDGSERCLLALNPGVAPEHPFASASTVQSIVTPTTPTSPITAKTANMASVVVLESPMQFTFNYMI